ncbi:MAG: tyrosine--tRNA ligase [Myxococcales bacterium]|nr:tyrosine--tRNA ligase [Myxococcales bacterium]
MELDLEKTLRVILSGIHEAVPEDALRKKVAKALAKGRPLRIKVGIDPTAPEVHIGHLVPYGKMRQLQDLGHVGVVVIGDYTAQIGDPTGRDATRQALTHEQVRVNAELYMKQLYTVLDPARTEVRYQTEWYGTFDLAKTLRLLQEVTLAQMLQHETFRVRYEQNKPLGLHELCYPVLQGYDSVAINADIEMGDPAQKFNILVGRDLMERQGMEPQVALLMPILLGTDGVEKMSKSLGNHVGVLMSPEDQFGRTMSIPDAVMENWYALFVGQSGEELAATKKQIAADPMGAKKLLAEKVVARFHGPAAAAAALEDFRRKFSERTLELENIPEARLDSFSPASVTNIVATSFQLSNSEVRRLVKQGGIKLDGDTLTDAEAPIDRPGVLKVGKKKWLRLLG